MSELSGNALAQGADHDGSSLRLLQHVDFAYQPIVTTGSLRVHGFEALARLPPTFPGICSLLDNAALTQDIRAFDLALLKKAVVKFSAFEEAAATRLFCNIDNRSYLGRIPMAGDVHDLLRDTGLGAENLCIEISERTPIHTTENLIKVTNLISGLGMRIALDDFGVGTSGLHMLLMIEPEYVKIDRIFIDGLALSTRKQAIVSKMCGLAHSLGFLTVAEGVENEADFRMARDLGCDLAQGFLIARPTVELGELSMAYDSVLKTPFQRTIDPRVAVSMFPLQPLYIDADLNEAVAIFRAHPDLRAIPVINRDNTIAGAILEEEMRRYLLSDYGPALLANKGAIQRIGQLVRRFPTTDAHGTIETIVNSYVAAAGVCGLILGDEGQFVGYLPNLAIVRLAGECEVSIAREQNPLTQLLGNRAIEKNIAALLTVSGTHSLVFFDFDNFKAFNDKYGFSMGDRALMIFADIIRKLRHGAGGMVGHIGGDDFYASIEGDETYTINVVGSICDKFATAIESLYSASDREAGGFKAVDRFGTEHFFPLLRVSAGILHLPPSRAHVTPAMVNDRLAAGKKKAKALERGIAVVRIAPNVPSALLDELGSAFGEPVTQNNFWAM